MVTYSFFPAAGYRNNHTGASGNRGLEARYWASSASDTVNGWFLFFGAGNANLDGNTRGLGRSVRCVALRN